MGFTAKKATRLYSDPQFSQSQTIAEAQRACSLSFGIDSIVELARGTQCGLGLAPFAGVAGFFALFFFSDVPKVRNDIWVKVPIVGEHFRKEIPPSDNVRFYSHLYMLWLLGELRWGDGDRFHRIWSCTYPARISPASICVMRAIHLRPAPMSFFHSI
ncbi:cytochrome b-c1 complex subunit 10 protein [Rutstroemia sp. NJR-2017a WRK4]|nr:cytochrome b-c1 complex subunit 10 protein [Rutstroemia sp. NJR-2017a WRK4]